MWTIRSIQSGTSIVCRLPRSARCEQNGLSTTGQKNAPTRELATELAYCSQLLHMLQADSSIGRPTQIAMLFKCERPIRQLEVRYPSTRAATRAPSNYICKKNSGKRPSGRSTRIERRINRPGERPSGRSTREEKEEEDKQTRRATKWSLNAGGEGGGG